MRELSLNGCSLNCVTSNQIQLLAWFLMTALIYAKSLWNQEVAYDQHVHFISFLGLGKLFIANRLVNFKKHWPIDIIWASWVEASQNHKCPITTWGEEYAVISDWPSAPAGSCFSAWSHPCAQEAVDWGLNICKSELPNKLNKYTVAFDPICLMMVVPRSPAQSTAIETAGRTFLDAYRRLNIVSIRTPKLESWTPKLESWTPPKAGMGTIIWY